MPRERSPNSIKAERLYLDGMPLTEIARRLGVPDGTVRRWKSTQKWDAGGKPKPSKKPNKTNKKKPSKKSETKSERSPKKIGAPYGNKNAVGNDGGAPFGNQNAFKHGAYSKILGELTDEEQAVIDSMGNIDEELALIDDIRILTVREMRIMAAIEKYRKAEGGLYVASVSRLDNKRKFDTPEQEEQYREEIQKRVDSGERLPGESYKLVTRTDSTADLIQRLEKELTTVQNHKTKAIQALNAIRRQMALEQREADLHELRKEMLDAQIEHIDAQTNKLIGNNEILEDTSEIDQILYGGGDETETS